MDASVGVRRSPIAAFIIAFGLVAAAILGGGAGYFLKNLGASSRATAATLAAVTVVAQPNSSRAQQEARRLFLLRGPRSYGGDDPIVVSSRAGAAQAQSPSATHSRLKSLGE